MAPLKGLVYGNSTVFHFAHTSEARGLMDFADFFGILAARKTGTPHIFSGLEVFLNIKKSYVFFLVNEEWGWWEFH